MEISVFLENIKKNQDEVVYYCCNHILSKKFDVNKDSLEDSVLRELFVDYDNFTKALNDSAGIIYKKYEAELDDVYKEICKIFNEDFDNAYLFNYRLTRVKNQEPKQFLNIEDKDTQETVIQKFEDKINAILESKYYKENKEKLAESLIIPQRTLELIKSAAGIY
ncbi:MULTISPECIES: hypothetical protein [Arcobacter]|jgi:HD superfamily phosphohydrolase|uniref:Uncharacterized protein n=1 Tax=Arcobacter ellisii TaxID=913109 RepID=A0A347U8I1_9BACT|nr:MULTISPECIES: hypothetical protein [Arcobacter]MBP9968070.1 hypothetical protein [Methanobrevibacter sp.]AXX95159.1 hypothetical protein AELL_1497 [Arcobacter ellisii]MDD3008596.1 hypothetical protein [Arcobacter sp.]MDY3205472.1 hypothetical protein [Arcobacter sp.]RXI30187.1 hypothetical protein CP962_09295 [Arcobacter ellisii]